MTNTLYCNKDKLLFENNYNISYEIVETYDIFDSFIIKFLSYIF